MKFPAKHNKFLLVLIILIVCAASVAYAQSGRRNPSRSDFPPDAKFVALTFDDGPNTTWTPLVLDRLKANNVTATFYVMGNKIDANTIPVMQRTIAEGHDICNHSFNHPSFGDVIDGAPRITEPAQARENLQKTSQAIFDATGYWPFSFRAPFLEWGMKVRGGIDVLAGLDREFNMAFIDTGIDPLDYRNQDNPQNIANRVLELTHDGGIILMHDCGGPDRSGTVASLDLFLPQLKARGFYVVSVRELFMLKGLTPELFYDQNLGGSGMWPRVNQRAVKPWHLTENPTETWRQWSDYERLWPNNTSDWWEQDWWACPTPPWERGTQGVGTWVACGEPIVCRLCGNTPCTCELVDCVICPECQQCPCTCNSAPCVICPNCEQCPCTCNGNTSIRNANAQSGRYGILLENAVVSDLARISVITPEPTQITLRILDNLGNAVHTAEMQCLRNEPCEIVWNLTNDAGRFVANATYLVVAQAKGLSGNVFIYSARLGVKR